MLSVDEVPDDVVDDGCGGSVVLFVKQSDVLSVSCEDDGNEVVKEKCRSGLMKVTLTRA